MSLGVMDVDRAHLVKLSLTNKSVNLSFDNRLPLTPVRTRHVTHARRLALAPANVSGHHAGHYGRIVDSHHHIWRQRDLPWLEGPMLPRIFGPYEPIRREYAIEEYLGDIEGSGIAQSIYVQANWAPARAVDEVAWVQAEPTARATPMLSSVTPTCVTRTLARCSRRRAGSRCCAASACSSIGTRMSSTASPTGLR